MQTRIFTLVSLCLWSLCALWSAAPAHAQSASADGTLRRVTVPILMYHYIGELPADADEYRVNLTVTPSQFETHLSYLQQNGYTTVTLDDLDAALQAGQPLPPKPIVLTFDDGHLDHYTNAFPALQRFGFSGTFFVITGLLDVDHPDYVNWEQAQEMEAAGMRIEPHTKSHLQLNDRGAEFLVYEVLGSIESVEAHLNRRPQMFSYPAGRYDEQTLSVVEAAGVQRAVTTQPGQRHTTDNRLELRRVRISGDTTAIGLHYILNSG